MICQENGEINQKVGIAVHSCDAHTLEAEPGIQDHHHCTVSFERVRLNPVSNNNSNSMMWIHLTIIRHTNRS